MTSAIPHVKPRRGVIRTLVALLALAAAGCAHSPEPASVTIDGEERLDAYLAGSAGRPCLIVDIDDTLVDGSFWPSFRLYFDLWAEATEPYPGAVEAMTDLAERWNVVLVTARPDSTAATTRSWLEAHGFPDFPVVYSKRILSCHDCRVGYKTRAIQELVRRGLRPVCGVGDKPSDLGAYARCGLEAVLLLEGYRDPDWSEARRILELASWGPERVAPSYRVLASTDGAWRWLVEHLPWNLPPAPGEAAVSREE